MKRLIDRAYLVLMVHSKVGPGGSGGSGGSERVREGQRGSERVREVRRVWEGDPPNYNNSPIVHTDWGRTKGFGFFLWLRCIKRWSFPFGSNLRLIFSMHLLILPYLDCSDSHAYTISLELCAGFNDSTHKTSLLHFESVILYAPLHKDKLRTTAGDRGGAGLFCKILQNS